MPELWIILVSILIAGVVKKRKELIVFFMSKRVIRMTMTLYTCKAGSHQCFPGSIYTIKNSSGPELSIVGSPFVIGHRVPVKCGGYKFFISGTRQHITCQLVDQKLIIRKVLIERIDQPVAITPDNPFIISFIS